MICYGRRIQRSCVFSCMFALLITLLIVACDNTRPIPLLPDLTQASSLVIKNSWSGHGGLEYVEAHYDLQREAEGFNGKVTFTVEGEPFDARQVITDVVIPGDIAKHFLSMIEASPVKKGVYDYADVQGCCDHYPSLSIELQVQEGKIRFYSPSKQVNGSRWGSIFKGGDRIPWAVDLVGKIHVINSAQPAEAYATLDAYLKKEVLKKLIEEIGENPEGNIPNWNSKS